MNGRDWIVNMICSWLTLRPCYRVDWSYNPEMTQILDAGTGSGVWLNRVARACPVSIIVTGIDIEGRLFPPPLPNTHMLVRSTLDLPVEWTTKFAHVHQRLMIVAFNSEAWKKSISEFFRILKPGGWIRLEELDAFRAGRSPLHERFIAGLAKLAENRGISRDNLPKIPRLLEEAGFRDLQFTQSRIMLGGEDMLANSMSAYRGFKAPFLRAGGLGLGSTEAEFDTFMDSLEDELRGSFDGLLFVTWTAQKPL